MTAESGMVVLVMVVVTLAVLITFLADRRRFVRSREEPADEHAKHGGQSG